MECKVFGVLLSTILELAKIMYLFHDFKSSLVQHVENIFR